MDHGAKADLTRHEALARIVRASNLVAEPGPALELLFAEAATLSGADEVALFRYDHGSGRLANIQTSLSPHGGRASFALGEGVVGQVAESGAGIVVGDADLAAGVVQFAQGPAPRSLLCLPLLSERGLVGVLSFVSFTSAAAWSTHDLPLLTPFAELATLLLDGRRLRHQLHARQEEIELLTSMNTIDPRVERHGWVLGQLANFVAELVRAEACAFVLGDGTGRFVLQPGFNVSGGETGVLPPSLRHDFGEGETFSGDPTKERTLPFTWLRDLGPCEVTLVPFEVDHELALLYVRNPTGARLEANEQSALQLAARQAAHLISNMRLYKSLQGSYFEAVASLATAIEAKDAGTKGHSEAVSQLAVVFGRSLNLDPFTLDSLRMSSLLHDIGKIGIRDSILLKEGPLDPDEWTIMKKHPELGAKIVRGLPIAERLLPGVLHHHERWDGKGYPHQLVGEQIPLVARITTIIDAYQVITSPRPYKKASPMDAAVAEIARCAGSQFDPTLARAFCENAKLIDVTLAQREEYTGYHGPYGESATPKPQR